ncbi:MAG: hypothetical protein JSV38_16050, partial [Desulfobacterales bacterium]
MKHFAPFALLAWVISIATLLACTGVQQPVKQDTATDIKTQTPKTLAIFPFENNSVTDPEQFMPLEKGLSAMLITDLTNNVNTLKVIERDKIQSLLKEIALSQSGHVDQSTAIKAGKILGAQATTFGSFMVLGPQVRIDARIIKVETSEVLMAQSILGRRDDFINLERALARKIAESLNADFQAQQTAAKSDISAALYFSKGVNAFDRGDKTEAERWFKKCID